MPSVQLSSLWGMYGKIYFELLIEQNLYNLQHDNVNDDKHYAFFTNQLPLENFDPLFSFLCGVGITEKCSVRHDNPEIKI